MTEPTGHFYVNWSEVILAVACIVSVLCLALVALKMGSGSWLLETLMPVPYQP